MRVGSAGVGGAGAVAGGARSVAVRVPAASLSGPWMGFLRPCWGGLRGALLAVLAQPVLVFLSELL